MAVTLAATDVQPVRRSSVEDAVAVTGNLQPVERIEVRARLEGELENVLVREGERVQPGQLLARLGAEGEGEVPGRFIAPHGVCIDSRGDIYVGEVSWTHTGSRLNPPREIRSLQKLGRQG